MFFLKGKEARLLVEIEEIVRLKSLLLILELIAIDGIKSPLLLKIGHNFGIFFDLKCSCLNMFNALLFFF